MHKDVTDKENIREVVDDLDRVIARLESIPSGPGSFNAVELHEAIKRIKEGRFWLQEIGHRGHFDTPVKSTAP